MPTTNTITIHPQIDSSLAHTVSQYTSFSIFKGHELQPIDAHKGSPVLTNVPVYYWPTFLLFIVFGLYVSIRITDPKKILKIIFSVFNLQVAKQLMREDYKLYKRVSVFLSFCFVSVFAFLLYKLNNHFDLILKENSAMVQYLFFVTVVIIKHAIKIVTTQLLSYITFSQEIGKEYVFNVFLFSQVIGLILFPFVVALQFSEYTEEWFLYPSMVIYFLFFGLRAFRGFVIAGLEQNSGFLYIILYFCALEILPLLVLVKFLLINF